MAQNNKLLGIFMLWNIPQNSSLIINSMCHLSTRISIPYSVSIWINQVIGEQLNARTLVGMTIIALQTAMTVTKQILPEYEMKKLMFILTV